MSISPTTVLPGQWERFGPINTKRKFVSITTADAVGSWVYGADQNGGVYYHSQSTGADWTELCDLKLDQIYYNSTSGRIWGIHQSAIYQIHIANGTYSLIPGEAKSLAPFLLGGVFGAYAIDNNNTLRKWDGKQWSDLLGGPVITIGCNQDGSLLMGADISGNMYQFRSKPEAQWERIYGNLQQISITGKDNVQFGTSASGEVLVNLSDNQFWQILPNTETWPGAIIDTAPLVGTGIVGLDYQGRTSYFATDLERSSAGSVSALAADDSIWLKIVSNPQEGFTPFVGPQKEIYDILNKAVGKCYDAPDYDFRKYYTIKGKTGDSASGHLNANTQSTSATWQELTSQFSLKDIKAVVSTLRTELASVHTVHSVIGMAKGAVKGAHSYNTASLIEVKNVVLEGEDPPKQTFGFLDFLFDFLSAGLSIAFAGVGESISEITKASVESGLDLITSTVKLSIDGELGDENWTGVKPFDAAESELAQNINDRCEILERTLSAARTKFLTSEQRLSAGAAELNKLNDSSEWGELLTQVLAHGCRVGLFKVFVPLKYQIYRLNNGLAIGSSPNPTTPPSDVKKAWKEIEVLAGAAGWSDGPGNAPLWYLLVNKKADDVRIWFHNGKPTWLAPADLPPDDLLQSLFGPPDIRPNTVDGIATDPRDFFLPLGFWRSLETVECEWGALDHGYVVTPV